MTVEQHDVSIEITCTKPPLKTFFGQGPVYLGIQKGEAVIDTEPVDARHIVFRPVLEVSQHDDGTPTFRGPFAHGPRAERFIYLSWIDQGQGKLIGRIKLHLSHIKWEDIEKAVARKKPIKVTLPLTDAKGKLVLASVRANAAQWSL